MKNWFENQRGSMAVYAIITILCFLVILTSLFFRAIAIRKGQLRTILEIMKAYQKNSERVEEIYTSRTVSDTSKYVQDDLVLFYDGINNTGNGHSNNATTWKDLSTSNFDGTLMNFGDNSWTDKSLTFDGIDDWVKIARMDYPSITIEIVMEYENLDRNSEIVVIANWQGGGYGIDIHDSYDSTYKDRNSFSLGLLGKEYQYVWADNPAKIGKKYILTGSYDGSTIKFWENGIKKESNVEGTIENTENNTIMVLGGNPNGENSSASFNGKIYAVRIYNRALTDEEVKQNYELDIQRYGIESMPNTVEEAIKSNYNFDETRTILDKNGNRITIPAGFKIVKNGINNTEYANPTSPTVDDGIVITDTTGNEFVWVPVDGENLKFAQDKTSWSSNTVNNYNDYTDWAEEEQVDFIEESVEKYYGFYVGRYEAGVKESEEYTSQTKYTEKSNIESRNKSEGVDLPASQKGLQSWNYINQENAKKLSEKMYANNDSVTSKLIDSYAWDTICTWLDKCGLNVTDSVSWGNYVNANSGTESANGLYSIHNMQYQPSWEWIINEENYGRGEISFAARNEEGTQDVYELATGILERNKAKNIYDFAGNMWEWTTEIGKHIDASNPDGEGSYAVIRGGSFNVGSYCPATCRNGSCNAEDGYVHVGFRVVLYVN